MPVCRLSVDVYEEMIRAGIITKDARIELLDGWLVPKMTKNPPHTVAAELVRNALHESVPADWCIFSAGSGSSWHEYAGTGRNGGPRRSAAVPRAAQRAEDVGLVVEVADASLARDQSLKKAIYAQAGIPVYWLVNLIDGRLEEYTDPAGSDEMADYRQRRDYSPNDEIPLVLDGRPWQAFPCVNCCRELASSTASGSRARGVPLPPAIPVRRGRRTRAGRMGLPKWTRILPRPGNFRQRGQA